MNAATVDRAGFWRRWLAYSLDWLLLAPLLVLLLATPLRSAWSEALALNTLLQDWLLEKMLATPGVMPSPGRLLQLLELDPGLSAAMQSGGARLSAALAQGALRLAACAAIYFIGFEASIWQATPGKRALGLRVSTPDGARIGLGRASARFFAAALSWLTLNLGHALAGWRSDGAALHDLVAGTRVGASGPMPRWGRWLLIAQLAALCALLLALLGCLAYLLVQLASMPG